MIHVPVVLTVLLVRQVVRIQLLLVLLERMPVVQQRVIHVLLGNTTINMDKLANHAILGNTMNN